MAFHLHVSPYKRPETPPRRWNQLPNRANLTPANDWERIAHRKKRLLTPQYLDELYRDRSGMCISGRSTSRSRCRPPAFYDIDAGLVRLSTFSTHSSYNKTFIVLFIIGSQLYGEQPNAKCNKKKTVFEILVKIWFQSRVDNTCLWMLLLDEWKLHFLRKMPRSSALN